MRVYSDPKRASDKYALSDVEVFYMSADAIASVFADNGIDPTDDRARENSDIRYTGPGWYYWFCFPGCMPDSEPSGPFATADLAIADMRENYSDDDPDDETDTGHVCTFGPFERSQLVGTLHRKCTVPGCSIVSLDGDE